MKNYSIHSVKSGDSNQGRSVAQTKRFPISQLVNSMEILRCTYTMISIGGRSDRDISETRRFDLVVLTAARSRFPTLVSLSTKPKQCVYRRARSDRGISETRRFDRVVLTAAQSRFPILISLSTKPKRCVYRRAERPGDIWDAAFRPRGFTSGP